MASPEEKPLQQNETVKAPIVQPSQFKTTEEALAAKKTEVGLVVSSCQMECADLRKSIGPESKELTLEISDVVEKNVAKTAELEKKPEEITAAKKQAEVGEKRIEDNQELLATAIELNGQKLPTDQKNANILGTKLEKLFDQKEALKITAKDYIVVEHHSDTAEPHTATTELVSGRYAEVTERLFLQDIFTKNFDEWEPTFGTPHDGTETDLRGHRMREFAKTVLASVGMNEMDLTTEEGHAILSRTLAAISKTHDRRLPEQLVQSPTALRQFVVANADIIQEFETPITTANVKLPPADAAQTADNASAKPEGHEVENVESDIAPADSNDAPPPALAA